MRFCAIFLIFAGIFMGLAQASQQIRDYETIRRQAMKNIASLETILDHRGVKNGRHKNRRIGGNIVMG
ncbi:unnamed protein product [Caenorhabditis angaria]|uniref:Uncharacterized protein n=1 Tax=Caenorhabditis angaria TaxID=860376 RepID=A0A9P1IF23_9PELO|nr:unnamed protein product [Caenorhabditis angaria]